MGLNIWETKTKQRKQKRIWKNEVLARQNNKCAECGKELDMRAVHIDHKVELQDGGKDTLDNLQALCSECHSIKTHKKRLERGNKEEKRKKSEPDILKPSREW